MMLRVLLSAGILLGAAFSAGSAWACPFCAAQSQTFAQEMASSDIFALVKLREAPPKYDPDSADLAKTPFLIDQVLKGAEHLPPLGDQKERVLPLLFFGEGQIGDTFLVTGVDPPKLLWSTPMKVTPAIEKYLLALDSLPTEGPARMAHFYPYLEHPDEVLARDAYDEFALAPYSDLIGIREQLNHEQVVGWIKTPEIPSHRRRLYFVMLSVINQKSDAAWLEKMMLSKDRKEKSALDAMIGCYLTLTGEKGLDFVVEHFITNKEASYGDLFASILALRFHATEDYLPREKIAGALRRLLERPQAADLVIPDLARMEDWSVVDRVVELFKTADENTWIKVPVINYLRACPLPVAAARLKELEKLDPDTVKRANQFFPFGSPGDSSSWQRPEEKGEVVAEANDTAPRISPQFTSKSNSKEPTAEAEASPGEQTPASETDLDIAHRAPISGRLPTVVAQQTSLTWVLGIPAAVGVGLFVLMGLILRSPHYSKPL
ncbi:hypothetical protein [Lignipirellula cremea]|uniref:Uncharacterized protein n=1 Tax=Lignipirellula cremea TaxID=2528010 RepID=A0A518DQP2_9BACT|nr:hypothetical protein [Lignipirellula cremea]QDU94156.1 hypothetical protein Pla8534_19440 [Lignipirellula cremea]